MKLSSIFAAKLRQSFGIKISESEHFMPTTELLAVKIQAVGIPFGAYTTFISRLCRTLASFGDSNGLSCIHTLLNFFPTMPKSEGNKVAANNSTRNSASGHETATSVATIQLHCSNPYSIPTFEDFLQEVQKRFEIESNAKNKAYHFICANGHLEDFIAFCREHYDDDYHAGCVASLYSKI